MKLKSSVILAALLCLGWNAAYSSLPNGTWTNASGGDFNDGTQWSNAVVPISSDNVVFNVNPTGPPFPPVVTVASDKTINNLDIIDTNIMLDLFDDNTLTVTNDTDLALNASDNATLTLLNGTLKTANLNSGVNGTALFDIFNGSTLEISSPLTITLGVNSGSDGKLALDGAGSQLLIGTDAGAGSEGQIIVGNSGKGTFHVHNGATPDIDASVIIGNQATSSASELRVDTQSGPGSTLTINDVYVGNLGEGLLQILDNSELTADSITVGTLGRVEGGGLINSDINNSGKIIVG